MAYQPIITETLSNIGKTGLFSFYKNIFVESDDPEHIHNCYEIYVNVKGDVSFLHNSNVYSLESGDVIISAPGEVHYCIYHSCCIHEHFCLWIDTNENSDIASYIQKHDLSGHIRLEKSSVQNLFSVMHRLNNENDTIEKTMHFFDLMKLLKNKNNSHKSNATLPEKMQEILNYVDEEYANIRFIEEIADKFHISIPTLNRWFREYVHLSPGKLLTAKKLAYAEKLLRSDRSVADVCYTAGFSDCSRFISAFKSKYGLTPLQYKKHLEQN